MNGLLSHKPVVSVIMPVHNAGKYISQAIESVLSQTLTNFELIIIDDTSSDNSRKIMKKYAKSDHRIRILINKTNTQVAASLNMGIRQAKSDLIARMDADDIAHPIRLELQYDLLSKHPDIAVVGANIQIIDKSGKTVSRRVYKEKDRDIKRTMYRYSPFAHPTVMMRKSVWKEFGGYDVSKVPCEDIDLWFKIGSKYQFANLNKYLLYYRLIPSSNSHSKLKHLELMGFSIKLQAFQKYKYPVSLWDVCYNIMEFFSMWIMPSGMRVIIYNILRSRNLV